MAGIGLRPIEAIVGRSLAGRPAAIYGSYIFLEYIEKVYGAGGPMDVKTLCLGVLSLHEASGYEIKKTVQDGPFGQFHAASFGSIYPALTGLCQDGCVTVRNQPQDGRPDKRVYDITAKGRQALLSAIMATPATDRVRSEFLFILFFGELLPARHLDDLLENRLAALRAVPRDMDAVPAAGLGPGARFVHGMGRVIRQAQIDYIEANRHALVAATLGPTAAMLAPGQPPGDGRPRAAVGGDADDQPGA